MKLTMKLTMKLSVLAFAILLSTTVAQNPLKFESAKAGNKVTLVIDEVPVKNLVRYLTSSPGKQTWNLSGPNKGFWVDENGKKIDSSNFEFKAPATLIIKKVTKNDEGLYDSEPLVEPTSPPGTHIDPGASGIQLILL